MSQQPETPKVVIPENMTLPHSATQVRIFARDRKTLLGSAVHDRTTVGFRPGVDVRKNKPTVDVLEGEPLVNLNTYISEDLLDGLDYPVF